MVYAFGAYTLDTDRYEVTADQGVLWRRVPPSVANRGKRFLDRGRPD